MATLTLRNVKGSALTHDELDSNFGALDSDITAINTTIAGGVGLGADSVNSLIDTRIDSDTFVTLTGDQTIGGIKTFSDSAVFSGPLFGDGSNLTGIESYDSAKVQGQIDSDFPTREIGGLFNVNAPTPVNGESLIYDSASSKWVAGTPTDSAQHTSAEIRQMFSGSGDISYNSTTGDISYTAAAASHDSVATQGQIDSAAVALTGTQTVAGAKTFSDTIDFDNFMSLTAAGGTQYISFDGGIDFQDDNGVLGSLFAISGTTGKITIPRAAVAGTQSASVSGATTLNFDTYQNFVLTLTGATTLSNPTTETVGQSGFITFITRWHWIKSSILEFRFRDPWCCWTHVVHWSRRNGYGALYRDLLRTHTVGYSSTSIRIKYYVRTTWITTLDVCNKGVRF